MSNSSTNHHKGKLFGLCLAALGVVYGDIGTSPLYALKEIFFGKEPLALLTSNILGSISLVFWALTLIVTIKYVFLVLRADHNGEGGVFALYGLLKKVKSKYKTVILAMLVLAAGLLFGDGLITPAISVLSAVEGMTVLASSMSAYVIPVTIAILVLLFGVQKYGTSKIGAIFGPIMLVWFAVIAGLGLKQVLITPAVLVALNPLLAMNFIHQVPIRELLIILGFVMLSVTGGEAMYADMGHFGLKPIKISWLAIAYPALIINYFGQGAFLLSGKMAVEGQIFYSMAPRSIMVPLIILSTMATVIASQALITGAFSLASQATALNLMPFLPTKHTHNEHEGQIFISFINVFLYVGCVTLVIVFRSSQNLASAYGLAVSGVMFVTTLSVALLADKTWLWPKWKTILIFLPFAVIDSVFLLANSLKFNDGGYVPLTIGLILAIIMTSWRMGTKKIKQEIDDKPTITVRDLLKIRHTHKHFTPQTIIMISNHFIKRKTDNIPVLKELFLKKYGVFPLHLLFVNINVMKKAVAEDQERFEVIKIDPIIQTGTIVSVRINFGFMEEIRVEPMIAELSVQFPDLIDKDKEKWVFHVFRPQLSIDQNLKPVFKKWTYQLFQLLHRNSMTEDQILELSPKANITAEVVTVEI